ncbi:DUF4232 domain-containing protein [Streptomyces sp. NPDC002054]|uniref:DUF4232 domain-containing protein n=1 Tax=Streptomyces sp. NPDC002054 TaxID=3154663 RepID=UPI00331E3EE6
MRTRARLSATAAALALSALVLTGCGGGDDSKAAAGTSAPAPSPTASKPAESASADPASKKPGSGGSSSGGNTGKTGGSSSGDSGGSTPACTTKNTQLQFVQSRHHASGQEPAQAALEVTNISKKTCTLVGVVTLTAKDDQGKAAPIETDNSGSGTDAVDIKAGGTATAWVAYTDLNFDGSQSGREVCAVQASKVEIALPKDVARTVKVIKEDGSLGSFNVCGTDVRVAAFEVS